MKHLLFTIILLFVLSACDENTTDNQDTEKKEETEEEYLTEIHLYQMGFPYCDTVWFYQDSFRWKVKEYCDVETSVFVDTVLTYEEIDTVNSEGERYILNIDFEDLVSSTNLDSIFAMDSLAYKDFFNPYAPESHVHLNFITNKGNKMINATDYQEEKIFHFDSVYKKVRDFRIRLTTWSKANIRD